jgi:hypothetical protein
MLASNLLDVGLFVLLKTLLYIVSWYFQIIILKLSYALLENLIAVMKNKLRYCENNIFFKF